MKRKILGLTYVSANQVLNLVSQNYALGLQSFGWDAVTVDLSSPDGARQLQNELQSGAVAFCFALQGVGSRLTMGNDGPSVWTHFKTPFLSLHHDNPCCNIYNHFGDSPYVANLYLFGCHHDIQKRFVKSDQLSALLPYELAGIPYEQDIRFKDRPIRHLFLKSGKSPAVFAEGINQVKEPLREALWAAIAKAEADENLTICDLLTEAFIASGHDPARYWAEFWGFADLIENYIRTRRAMRVVEWLKFQEGAVIIGDGWDFIDKTNTKAIFKPSVSGYEANRMYNQTQFVFNTSPYGYDLIHERIPLGLCNRACVVSDTNAWWDTHFADVPSLFRFHWGQDIAAQCAEAIHDPHAASAADSAIGARRVEEKLYGYNQMVRMPMIAEQVRAFAVGKGQ